MKTRIVLLADPTLFVMALLATTIGIFMVCDAGYARSVQSGAGLIPREFRNQLMFACLGLLAFWLCMCVSAKRWRSWAIPLFGINVAFLVLVLIPVIGIEMNGSRRWLGIAPWMVQPAEWAKLAVILMIAATMADRLPWRPYRGTIENWGHWMDAVAVPFMRRATPLVWALIAALLIELEPDLGTAAVVVGVAFWMCLMAGVRARWLVALVLMSVVAVGLLLLKEPYRLERFTSHAHRWEVSQVDSIGYQTTQSETAMASGGAFGVGVGAGRAKHVIPAPTSDFIMATVAEEFGLLGASVVLVLLGAMTWRLFFLAGRAPSAFRRLVLAGVGTWIGLQSAVNLLMASGAAPPIGIPLPFISSGGSSLVALWMAMGICQAVARHGVGHKLEEESVAVDRDRWRHGRPRLSRA